MIAKPDNPCVCGNRDYSVLWCKDCKRPEDEILETTPLTTPFIRVIANQEWLNNLRKMVEESNEDA